MTGPIDTDRVLAAFLAPQHDALPERVLDAAFADIARTPQRRPVRAPWRFPRTNNLKLVAFTAASIAVAIGGTALLSQPRRDTGGPTARPTPSTFDSHTPASVPPETQLPHGSPAAETVRFTSPQYGYSVAIPATWSVTTASDRWSIADGEDLGLEDNGPYVDRFVVTGREDAGNVAIAAKAIPDGMTAAGWLVHWQNVRAVGGLCFGSGVPWVDASVNGVEARRFGFRCDSASEAAASYDEYTFVVGRMAYVISGTPSMTDVLVPSFKAP